MALKRKSRYIGEGLSNLFFDNTYYHRLINEVTGNESTVTGKWPTNLRGYQVTDSEGHPFWPRDSRPDGDVGGPFKTRKVYVKSASSVPFEGQVDNSLVHRIHTNGYMLPSPYDGIVNTSGGAFNAAKYPDLSSSDSELIALGTTAISLCNPVNPVFDASTAVAELVRDGLPTISGMQALKERRASSAGGEFLNVQFGIMPLINDIKNLTKALQTHDKVIEQLRRDSGRFVRRSYGFPMKREVIASTTQSGSLLTSAAGFNLPLSGITAKQTVVSKKRWFSGAFTYYLPDDDSLGGLGRLAQEADAVFGVVPDVADLWNLIPWSWLVDWFVNVGPVLTNLVNFAKYGLVLPYGYMMEHTIVEYQYTYTPSAKNTAAGGGVNLVIVDETKKRVQATPFGFGVTWDGFNPGQLAILAALGLSKSRW